MGSLSHFAGIRPGYRESLVGLRDKHGLLSAEKRWSGGGDGEGEGSGGAGGGAGDEGTRGE